MCPKVQAAKQPPAGRDSVFIKLIDVLSFSLKWELTHFFPPPIRIDSVGFADVQSEDELYDFDMDMDPPNWQQLVSREVLMGLKPYEIKRQEVINGEMEVLSCLAKLSVETFPCSFEAVKNLQLGFSSVILWSSGWRIVELLLWRVLSCETHASYWEITWGEIDPVLRGEINNIKWLLNIKVLKGQFFNMFYERKQEKLVFLGSRWWKCSSQTSADLSCSSCRNLCVDLWAQICWFGVNDGILQTIQTWNYSKAWNRDQGGKCCWGSSSELTCGCSPCLPRAVLHRASPRAHAEGPAQRLLPEGHQGGHPQLQWQAENLLQPGGHPWAAR